MESASHSIAGPAARPIRSRLWQCAAGFALVGGMVAGAANADWLGYSPMDAPLIGPETVDKAQDPAGGGDPAPHRDRRAVEASAQGASAGRSVAIRRLMRRASDDGAIPIAARHAALTGSSVAAGAVSDLDFAIAGSAGRFGSADPSSDQTFGNANDGGFGGGSGMGASPDGGGGGGSGGAGTADSTDPAAATDGGALAAPVPDAPSGSEGVPEPATWAMMAVGLGLAGAALRAGRPRISR